MNTAHVEPRRCGALISTTLRCTLQRSTLLGLQVSIHLGCVDFRYAIMGGGAVYTVKDEEVG